MPKIVNLSTFSMNFYVPEVPIVHMNESKKKNLLFLERFFFSSREKINFRERKRDFLKYFFKFVII